MILAPADKANGGFSGILVSAEEIYLHRGKALISSDLWNSEKHLRRSVFPSLTTALTEQIAGAVGGSGKTGALQDPPVLTRSTLSRSRANDVGLLRNQFDIKVVE